MINSLRGLVFFTGAAIALSLIYALLFGASETRISANNGENGEPFSQTTIRGDGGEFSLRDENYALKAQWRGDIELAMSGNEIEAVDNSLTIKLEKDGVEEQVVFNREGRGLATLYRRDGEDLSATPDAQSHIEEITLEFLRVSGIEAKQRVGALLKQGGADAVIAELDHLRGDPALEAYVDILARRTELSSAQRLALINAARRITSDHELSRALQSLIDHQDLKGKELAAITKAAKAIGNDYDKRNIVTGLAGNTMNDEAADRALDLFEDLGSDHDLRIVAEALLANKGFDADHAARLLYLARDRIDSDHDLRRTLKAAAPRLNHAGLAEAWLGTWETLESDYEKRVALEEAAAHLSGDAAIAGRFRSAATAIGSSHEREKALEAFGEP